MNILILISQPFDATGLYRIYYQYKQFTNGNNIKFVPVFEDMTIDFTDIQIVIFHYSLATKQIIDRLNELKIHIVLDIDDSINLPPYHLLYKDYTKSRREELIYCIEQSDTITCSTIPLQEELLQYNNNVIVLPNFIPSYIQEDIDKVQHVPSTNGKVRIGYLGGICHKHDINLLKGLNYLLQKNFKDKYEFYLFGGQYNKDYLNMYNILTTNGKYKNNFYVVPLVKLEEYYTLYKRIDISIAPLVDDSFNKCKSNLKFIESTVCNVPLVASNVYPYSQSIVDGIHGWLFDDKVDLIESIDILMDKDERDRIVNNAKIKLQNQSREELNKQIITQLILK